jgi:replication factor A1
MDAQSTRGLQDKKISDLHPESRAFNLRVRVHHVNDPVRIPGRDGRPDVNLVEAVVGDDTGRVILSLWGEDASIAEPGDGLHVEDAFVKLVRGSIRVSTGRRGRITPLPEAPDADANAFNISDAVHGDAHHAPRRHDRSRGAFPRSTDAPWNRRS